MQLLFAQFVAFFAIYTLCSDDARFETTESYFYTARLAVAIKASVDTFDRLVDFRDELTFAISDANFDVEATFLRSEVEIVGQVRAWFNLDWRWVPVCFFQELVAPRLKHGFEIVVLRRRHVRFVWHRLIRM